MIVCNANEQDHVLWYKDLSTYFLEGIELLLQHSATFSGVFLSQKYSLDLTVSMFSSLHT